MLKALLRPGMIFAAFIIGAVFQSIFHFSWQINKIDIATWYIRVALMIMFYFISLGIKLEELKFRKEHVSILLLNLAMGLVPYGVFRFLGYPELALAAFFTGISPTANAAPFVMGFLNGKVGFVLSGFVLTNVVISLAMILLLPIITGQSNSSYMVNVAFQMVVLIGIPLLLGAITRKLYSKATSLPKKFKLFNFTLWCTMIGIISARTTEFFFTHKGISWTLAIEIMVISLFVCILNFALGYLLSCKEYKRESSQTLGQKNTSFTIFSALAFGGPMGILASLGPAFYVIWHNCWNAFQMYMVDKKKLNEEDNIK